MRLPLGLLKRLLAGVVFGIYIGYLLYFLNPQLPVSVGRIVAACTLYGLICGIFVGGGLWLARLTRIRLFGRDSLPPRLQGFGMVAFAVFLAGLVYWYHLSVFRIYLPTGAVRVLSKATTLVAATAFVLFVLWLFDRTSTARRSAVILVCGGGVVLLSAVLLYQRRDGYRSEVRDIVRAELSREAGERPMTVVAVRSLSQDWLLKLEGEGYVPTFAALSARGYRTRIVPFRSSSPKALWASLATGQLPARHGVTGRFSYRMILSRGDEAFSLLPGGVGFRAWGLVPPVERVSAQLPAGDSVPFWTAFTKAGSPAAVVNWEGARPATTLAGAVVSDRWIEQFDLSPGEVAPADIAELPLSREIPRDLLLRIAPLPDTVRASVIKAMANDTRAADVLLTVRDRTNPLLRVVALNGLADTITALALSDHELPGPGSPEGVALRAHIELIDRLLSELSLPTDQLVVVVSPSGSTTPAIPGSFTAAQTFIDDRVDPGRGDGFVILSGPPFRPRANPPSASIVDVVPTLLYGAGLPIARDMDGAIIIDAFDEETGGLRSVSLIPSYEAQRIIVHR